MKKIRIIQVVFADEISGFEIPAFRGAIIEKAGKDSILFHNHFEENKFRYRYPLIQYKVINRKPCIICIEQGVDEIHKFFENKSWSIEISGRILEMKVERLNLNTFVMQVWNKMFAYGISNWLALNQENYLKYKDIENLSERISFLESTLKANIISMAKGIDWTVDKNIELKIMNLLDTRPVTLKGKKLLGFNLTFNTNVFLPNYLGLGKSVSVGYGTVKQLRND